MIVEVDQTNLNQTKQFIKENLKYSGFLYGNLEMEGAENYIYLSGNQIVAMTNNLNHKYVTYLIPPTTNEKIARELIEFMQTNVHSGGTVIGDYFDILNDYYELPANAINEIATIENGEVTANHQDIEYLTLRDVIEYKQALDTITEFQPRDLASVVTMFENSIVVGIKVDGKIVSAATLSALSEVNAVVTGVFTIKSEEGNGYAKAVVSKLLADYGQGRTISIFFTNPIAKHIYLSLGFEVEEHLIMFNRKE